MQVIAHQAEPVNPIAETDSAFLQQQIEAIVVFVAEKYQLAPVTTEHDVIGASRNVEAGFPGHILKRSPKQDMI